jgi:hypothetical protein
MWCIKKPSGSGNSYRAYSFLKTTLIKKFSHERQGLFVRLSNFACPNSELLGAVTLLLILHIAGGSA